MVSTKLVVLALLAAGLAYYLWTPVPNDLDQKAFFRYVCVLKKVIRPLNWMGPALFGHTIGIHTMRAVQSLVTRPRALDEDPQLEVTNEVFNGIPVRVYRPRSAPVPTPVLMHFHGGGWALGSIEAEDVFSRYLAKQTERVVVSVEYRLAPEHPFPAALDDCVAATVHVLTHGLDLALDTGRVGVIGLSAGGNLAATVSLRLQDPEFQKLPRLEHQVLLNPCLQGMDHSLPSGLNNDHITGDLLSRQDMAGFYLSYAGLELTPGNIEQVTNNQHIRDETKSKLAKYIHRDLLTNDQKSSSTTDRVGGPVNETLASLAEPVFLNYLLSPLTAPPDVLKRVPRAMLVMSHYDVLHDDGVLYVRRLRQAGVEVTSHTLENGHHVSMLVGGAEPGSDAAAEAYEKVFKFIKEE